MKPLRKIDPGINLILAFFFLITDVVQGNCQITCPFLEEYASSYSKLNDTISLSDHGKFILKLTLSKKLI